MHKQLVAIVMVFVGAMGLPCAFASEGEHPVERHYAPMPIVPPSQTEAEAATKSAGCQSCHVGTEQMSMHESPGVTLGCVDCHGGDASKRRLEGSARNDRAYKEAMAEAHVLPLYEHAWHYPHSANPERTYTLLNRESPEFVRFVNPSDFRVARLTCGVCHAPIVEASVRSMHSTGVMLWGGASYNNGILPYKNYLLGESYNEEGEGTCITSPTVPREACTGGWNGKLPDEIAAKGILPVLYPLPAWETIKPADIFRVFERGGRNIANLFPETGLPNSAGQLQRIEEPGRPDLRQSNRGPGTGARIAVPVINITKTRLNDPFTWFMGTNDQPGDYRSSGCASCHVVYANDRDPRHSGRYAQFGHGGTTVTADVSIPRDEPGHPLTHTFTRAVPSSQCMICHMHQPNMFMNTYLGYTMWDYESDAPAMWPTAEKKPSHDEVREILDRNPEAAAVRGKWGDVEFLKTVADLNPQLNDTQFADYHGHGWNFRAVFKRDRKGNLLDADGRQVADTDPQKFKKAVHLSSVHVDVGMHCVDCHYAQDSHGNGWIHGEVAAAVEIGCKDCHGTAAEYPNLYTSGPAALAGGADMATLRTPDGRRRFEWIGGSLYQRSMMNPELEWRVSLVKDSVTPGNPDFNAKAARAKLMSRDTATMKWGRDVAPENLAHSTDSMECYTCHTSWTTSCGGCHLPIEANAKTERHHYEGGESRNYATYNPQVARDEMFLIGKRESTKGGKFAPVRSSSALVLSSTNSSRERIYVQQAPIAASGFSSQAFNPHFPHTERKTETKTCTDCHLSEANDNNAIMAQLLALGTNYINFVGYHAYVGGDGEITAVRVTEWDEPQAVIGSYLHKYAYPERYAKHKGRAGELEVGIAHDAGTAGCLQLRGEYLYVAQGKSGFEAYDAASVGNKGFSQPIITAPFSPLGHDTQIGTKNATCVALPTNQPIHPPRNAGDLMRVANEEQPFHPIYHYAVITDSLEGLILTNVDTLADGDPRNNHLERTVTWNEGGVLTGARHVTLGGYYAYVIADRGLVVVNLNDPLHPAVAATLPLDGGRASALQFRYLFVTTRNGLEVVDVTNPTAPKLVSGSGVTIRDAHRVYVARTYAYVAAGAEGLVIVDAERPEQLREYSRYNANGRLSDSRDVVVATTNASAFAYVADGKGGLKVLQLTSPDSQPKFYGFSPEPKPELIAEYATGKPALSLSKGLDRDRGVDETGGQIAVFGRKGSRPLNLEEMRRLYLDASGQPWFVSDDAGKAASR
jgi:hypothetical protein